jgi:ribokinase
MVDSRFISFGSLNVDLNVRVPRFPVAGETVTGGDFFVAFGGKGANQAVALARLALKSAAGRGEATRRDDPAPAVSIAGLLGADGFGRDYRDYLAREGLDLSLLGERAGATGTALIEIEDSGANRIVVVPGANGSVDPSLADAAAASIPAGTRAYALLQLEVPLAAVERALAAFRARGAVTVLDPAPAQTLPDSLWGLVDYATPNETETAFYTGIRPTDADEAKRAASWFLARGTGAVVVKAGGNGSWLFSADEAWECPAFPVTVVDTTACGDSFNAGFAFALSMGLGRAEALRWGNATGGLSATRSGAQGAMPNRDSVEGLIRAWPKIEPRRR